MSGVCFVQDTFKIPSQQPFLIFHEHHIATDQVSSRFSRELQRERRGARSRMKNTQHKLRQKKKGKKAKQENGNLKKKTRLLRCFSFYHVLFALLLCVSLISLISPPPSSLRFCLLSIGVQAGTNTVSSHSRGIRTRQHSMRNESLNCDISHSLPSISRLSESKNRNRHGNQERKKQSPADLNLTRIGERQREAFDR